MKFRYVRDDMEVSPVFVGTPQYVAMKEAGDIVFKSIMRDGFEQPVEFFRQGAVVEHPNAWLEVQQGTAIPADEACAMRCRMSKEDMEQAQYRYERLVRRIEPDDFDLYDAGVITGYDENGDYVLGENGHLLAEMRPVDGVLSDDSEESEV